MGDMTEGREGAVPLQDWKPASRADPEECPNWPSNPCPYPKGQCSQMCVDSWDGDNCFVRKGEEWVWSGDE